jgi:hypothetical protein
MANQQMLWLPLTLTLSRKRERGRAAADTAVSSFSAGGGKSLLPLAGEGGAKRRMRGRLSASHPDSLDSV